MLRSVVKEYILAVLQISFVVVLCQILWPGQTANNDIRMVFPALQIHLNHQSPPYIALQAVLKDLEMEHPSGFVSDMQPIRLGAGKGPVLKLEPLRIQRAGYSSLSLKRLKLSRYDFGYARPSETPWNEVDENLIALEQDWVKELSPLQRRRLEIASERSKIFSEDWRVPDFRDLAEVKLFEGLAKEDAGPVQKKVTISGVIRNEGKNSSAQVLSSGTPRDSENSSSVAISDPERLTINASNKPLSTASVNLRPATAENEPVRITGPLLLEGGLVMGEGSIVEVYRNEEGYRAETGSVDYGQGNFEIDVPARYGKLVARVLSSDGHILGRGEVNLADYKQIQEAQGIYDGLKIAMYPYREGLAGVTRSITDLNNQGYIASSQLEALGLDAVFVSDELGRYHLPMVAPNSSMLIRAFSSTHVESLSAVVTGRPNEISMLSGEMLSALDGYLEDMGWDMSSGLKPTLLWGRVVEAGKPVQGVTVSSEMAPGNQPIYLDEDLKPNADLTSTTHSGFFVFVGLPQGFHPLLAKVNGKYWSHGNVPVTSDAIGYLQIENEIKKTASDVIVYDSIYETPKDANLLLQSLDEVLKVSKTGLRRVDLPKLHRQSFLIYKGSDEYLPSLHSYIDDQSFIYVPLISKEWWNEIHDEQIGEAEYMSEERTSNEVFKEEFKNYTHLLDQGGNITGFVQGDDFEVVWNGTTDVKIEPIYFDKNGEIVPEGIAGGGFILSGIPPGHGSVIVFGKEDPFIHSQLAATEKGLISVHHFQLGRL